MSPASERPTLFVLLGAAGDLARRLVVPALFALHRARMLPRDFRLVGLDRAPLDAQALAAQSREDASVSVAPQSPPTAPGMPSPEFSPTSAWT